MSTDNPPTATTTKMSEGKPSDSEPRAKGFLPAEPATLPWQLSDVRRYAPRFILGQHLGDFCIVRCPTLRDMWLFQPRQPDPHLLGLSIA
jgi:hypothetical protein